MLAATGMVTLSATAMAQQPVEQTVGDVSPLSVSLRRLEVGLRQPVGFDQVYRVTGEDGEDRFMRRHGGLRAVFPRSLYSTNRSQQSEALIPPNTVFQIGPRASTDPLPQDHPRVPDVLQAGDGAADGSAGQPAEDDPRRIVPIGYGPSAAAPQQQPSPTRRLTLDRRAETMRDRAERGVGSESSEQSGPSETFHGDETYRRERMLDLLSRAAHAESQRESSDHAARGRSSSSSK